MPSTNPTSGKRKSNVEGSELVQKQAKTKAIRKIQNGSAYGLKASDVVLGGNLTEDAGEVEDANDADDDDDGDEIPDNLTFGEKTLGALVQQFSTFQNTMQGFFSIASKQAATSNSLLVSMNKKIRN
jgi:hypothetical protein